MREKLGSNVDMLTKPGRHADGGGLYLLIKPDGRRTWVFRWRDRFTGKLRDKGLGPYGKRDVTLSEARDLAAICRKQVSDNKDPIAEARQRRLKAAIEAAGTLTFKACLERYIDAHKDGWKNAKHTAQWTNTLNKYAEKLMPLNVADVNTQMVIDCIQPIWKTKTETATRVRQRIESVLDWATAHEFRTGDNPARWKGHIENLLPKPRKVTKVVHRPALDYQETGAFMAKLRAVDTVAAKVLEFQILTATRPGEATGALWDEINLKAKILPSEILLGKWTIPADRMKADKEHEIPLSLQAVALLKALPRTNEFVFPGHTGKKSITSAAGMKLLKELHPGITQHGFRSTFRVWGSEQTSFPQEVLEHALAHRIKDKAQAAYDRKTMFPKRIRLMNGWANYCDQILADVDNVTPIRKGVRSC